jgi:hypothetical protein
MESFAIESVVAATRQSSELALGQILDDMAEVNSADGVDQMLELFLNDMIKSTIVADPIEAADGLYQPLIDILA